MAQLVVRLPGKHEVVGSKPCRCVIFSGKYPGASSHISTMSVQESSMLADSSTEFFFLISLMHAVTLIRASKESFHVSFIQHVSFI